MFLFLHLFLLQLVLDTLSILEVVNKGLDLSFSFTLTWFDLHVISGSWMTPRHSLFRIFDPTATNRGSRKISKGPSCPADPQFIPKFIPVYPKCYQVSCYWLTQARRWTSTATVCRCGDVCHRSCGDMLLRHRKPGGLQEVYYIYCPLHSLVCLFVDEGLFCLLSYSLIPQYPIQSNYSARIWFEI